MHARGRRLWIPLLAGALAMTGCQDVTGGGDARLSILLTDAPGDLAEAWVEITEIYLQGSTAENGERVTLYEGSTGLIDLLTLAGGTTAELIKDVTVPEGTYAQLRFRIGEARIVTEDGREFSTQNGTLLCPSCNTPSGLKVNLPGGALQVSGGYNVVVVDFDVSQSFGKERGRSGRWVMHPVLHASDFQLSGAIAGTATLAEGVTIPACGGQARDLSAFVPTAAQGSTVRSGVTQADGRYVITYLPAGTYTLGAARVDYAETGESLSFTVTPEPASVTVQAQQTASANFTITGATCAPTPTE
jgi:hypothetical protein